MYNVVYLNDIIVFRNEEVPPIRQWEPPGYCQQTIASSVVMLLPGNQHSAYIGGDLFMDAAGEVHLLGGKSCSRNHLYFGSLIAEPVKACGSLLGLKWMPETSVCAGCIHNIKIPELTQWGWIFNWPGFCVMAPEYSRHLLLETWL